MQLRKIAFSLVAWPELIYVRAVQSKQSVGGLAPMHVLCNLDSTVFIYACAEGVAKTACAITPVLAVCLENQSC